jgi:putative transposase
VDEALSGFGLNVLKTPVRSPMANAHCERVIGTIRREWLDYMIPMTERHLKRIVREFATYYNPRQTTFCVGPGLTGTESGYSSGKPSSIRTGVRLPNQQDSGASGLHHDYRLEKEAA